MDNDAYSTGKLLGASLTPLQIDALLIGLVSESKGTEQAVKEWVQKNFEYVPEDDEITWG